MKLLLVCSPASNASGPSRTSRSVFRVVTADRRRTSPNRFGSSSKPLFDRNKAFFTLLGAQNKGGRVPFLHLLRHGTHGDVGVRLTGREPDGGLTEEGRNQARQAADRLRGRPLSIIYSSPRRRTVETASIVADVLGLEVRQALALDEVDFGSWSGCSFDELEADPRWRDWNDHRSSARCPGGETMAEAQARALAFAFEVAARHQAPPLLVTHCDIIRALHCWSERRPLDQIHATDCPPGYLSKLDLFGEDRAAA